VCVSWKLKCWILLMRGVTMKFGNNFLLFDLVAKNYSQVKKMLEGTWGAHCPRPLESPKVRI